jgi:hypothetical protein
MFPCLELSWNFKYSTQNRLNYSSNFPSCFAGYASFSFALHAIQYEQFCPNYLQYMIPIYN